MSLYPLATPWTRRCKILTLPNIGRISRCSLPHLGKALRFCPVFQSANELKAPVFAIPANSACAFRLYHGVLYGACFLCTAYFSVSSLCPILWYLNSAAFAGVNASKINVAMSFKMAFQKLGSQCRALSRPTTRVARGSRLI